MTAHSGIPASEAAELQGRQYEAALARKELGDTVRVLAERVAHRPTAGQLAMRLAGASARRMSAPARRAAHDRLPQVTHVTQVTRLARQDGNPWLPAAVVAGTALAVVLAVATIRHRQRSTR